MDKAIKAAKKKIDGLMKNLTSMDIKRDKKCDKAERQAKKSRKMVKR